MADFVLQEPPLRHHHHHHHLEPSSFSVASLSSSDSESDLEDLITPCQSNKLTPNTPLAPEEPSPFQNLPKMTTSTTTTPSSSSSNRMLTSSTTRPSPVPPPHGSVRRCSTDATIDLEGLWKAMLELQRRYDCYKSTRMRLAADDEEAYQLIPSRACIDHLNDSIDSLPEEGWKMLEPYLSPVTQ